MWWLDFDSQELILLLPAGQRHHIFIIVVLSPPLSVRTAYLSFPSLTSAVRGSRTWSAREGQEHPRPQCDAAGHQQVSKTDIQSSHPWGIVMFWETTIIASKFKSKCMIYFHIYSVVKMYTKFSKDRSNIQTNSTNTHVMPILFSFRFFDTAQSFVLPAIWY